MKLSSLIPIALGGCVVVGVGALALYSMSRQELVSEEVVPTLSDAQAKELADKVLQNKCAACQSGARLRGTSSCRPDGLGRR